MGNVVENIFENGSKWLRADFHLHTKADKEFNYIGNENDFVNDYVHKLVEQNIRIGIITNHNKFDLGEYKAISKKAHKENIFILPGVELSVNDGANGVHTLIIFDPNDWLIDGSDYINQFITTNFVGKHNFENENGRSVFSLKETLEQLKKLDKKHFIVMAHIEQNSGLLAEFDGGRIQDLGNNPIFRNSVIGFQKMRTDKQKANLQIWLDEKIPCFVEGSDPKSIDEIGKGDSCFIKIGDFNFEAVQYALTDSQNRVSLKEPPEIHNPYIKSISFEGGRLDKTKIDFSPELNNLIGIRGSGKSSILEILRYTLGILLSPIAVDQKYKNGLIENVLGSGGKSIVTVIDKYKKEYRIEKIYGQKEDIYKDSVMQTGISIEAIFDLPVYFGQKDLSNKDTDFEVDLIRRLTGTRLKDIQSKIEQKKREVENIIAEIRKHRNLNELKKETETVIQNSKFQLEIFKQKGVEEKLKQQTLFDSDVSKLSQSENSVKNYIGELESIISNNDYLFLQEIVGSEINQEFFYEAKKLLSELKSEFEKLKAIHNNSIQLHRKYKELVLKINSKKEGLKEEFAKIKRGINTDTINPDNFLTLNRQIEISQLKLLEIEKTEKKRKEWQDDLLKKLTDLDNLWVEEYQLLGKEIDKINKAESKLSIAVKFKDSRNKFIDKMKQIFKGSGIRETAYQEIEATYKDFIQIYKDSSKLNDILNENQVVDFKRKFSENLEDLLTFKVDNKIIIQYNDKSLDKHSLGQRASALILFLLAQKENDILIIDQPEDDLDNQTIYDEVIKELKKIKGNMQFIFATHNANIPVLGDSEMVIACQYIDGKEIQIETGGIDYPAIQEKIVHIMEGGKEAFDRRKNIYEIWGRSVL